LDLPRGARATQSRREHSGSRVAVKSDAASPQRALHGILRTVSRVRIIAAFAAVYVIWGSTYAAIRIGVMALPPAALSGVRFTIAGAAMTAFAIARGHSLPRTLVEWRMLFVLGLTMVVLSNGLVTWAEQYVASNQAALIVASSALWTAWLGTFGPRAHPLSARSKLGVLTGFAGVALLFWPREGFSVQSLGAQCVLLVSAFSWSWGGIHARNHPIKLSPLMFAGMQMSLGGLMMLAVSVTAGEMARLHWSASGVAALAYLMVFGSCVAYASYFWLIHHTTPDRLSTIAYVNPAVATLLGWVLLGERLTGMQLLGMAVILTGVALVVWQSRDSR
jgi:drug/metabolite transporter (DMT)-like permease